MAPVRVARAFRLPIIAAVTALALSGCMQATGPVASAQPRNDLDAMAYGQPYNSAPSATFPARSAVADSVGALRPSSAASPRNAYAAAPMPVTHDTPYRLDAGDKLRVVVY